MYEEEHEVVRELRAAREAHDLERRGGAQCVQGREVWLESGVRDVATAVQTQGLKVRAALEHRAHDGVGHLRTVREVQAALWASNCKQETLSALIQSECRGHSSDVTHTNCGQRNGIWRRIELRMAEQPSSLSTRRVTTKNVARRSSVSVLDAIMPASTLITSSSGSRLHCKSNHTYSHTC